MKIDKIRLTPPVEHNITSLKIAIKEAVTWLRNQVFGKHSEVGFKLQFVKIELCRFQEAILKIVKIEAYAVYIEFGLRIATIPI